MIALIITIILALALGLLAYILLKILIIALIVIVVVMGGVYWFTYEALSEVIVNNEWAVLLGTFVIGSFILWLISLAMDRDENSNANHDGTLKHITRSKSWLAISKPLTQALGFLFMLVIVSMVAGIAGGCFYFVYVEINLPYDEFEVDISLRVVRLVGAAVIGLALSRALLTSFIAYVKDSRK